MPTIKPAPDLYAEDSIITTQEESFANALADVVTVQQETSEGVWSPQVGQSVV
jgi:hypothetical protein